MKTVVVTDAFMTEAFYRKCFAGFPQFEITNVVFFGTPDRLSMRVPVHKIEREGAEAVEPPQELYDVIGDAEVLMVHLCPVNKKLISMAKNLKVILTNRGGLENVNVQAATEAGIPVLNNPAHNANSVAELTIGLMISEMRNLARTHTFLENNVWQEKFHNSSTIHEIKGSTVGLIGFGNIGRRVARKLTVFDCKVLVHDDWVSPDDPDLAKYNATWVPLDTLMRESDIVSLHLRCDTRRIFREDLEKMKPTAYFINTARPHLVDNNCLYEMLRDGKLMGAAFDVFMNEPMKPEDDYLKLDNVTLSNHRGGDTVNCYSDSPAMLLEECTKLFNGQEPLFWPNKKELEEAGVKAPTW